MIERIISFSMQNRLLVLLMGTVLIAAGGHATFNLSLDAIPDISDVQVIVVTEFEGQSPEVVEDQVTYPLTSAMLSVPGTTAVRGYSMFGLSFVYVLFDDHTDLYWARSRVLEYLSFAANRLPPDVQPQLGPDATGVGWVYQYVLYPGYYSPDHPRGLFHDAEKGTWFTSKSQAPAERRGALVRVRAWEEPGHDPLTGRPLVSANQDLASLRSLQDWYLRYPLTAVEGVAEVAAIGGFVKQYQVLLDPQKLEAFGISLAGVVDAIRQSNNDVGGAVIERAEHEYMVRSRGYLRGLDDLKNVVVGLGMEGETGGKGVPILLGDIATLQIAGESRRGIGELDGKGEAVGGVVIARIGADAYEVIRETKAALAVLEDGLPPGVFIKPTYDRSLLIERSVETLKSALLEEMLVVGLISILFLLHARSELVAMFVVPSSVLASLLLMEYFGINANIMSLGGIAIAIGVIVDSSVVMVENAHKHLDHEEERRAQGERTRPRGEVIFEAAREVGPALFFSLLIVTVSFLPVFVLGQESGRLFRPLAFTKTFSMAAAALLSVTIVPVLMYYLINERILPARWPRRKVLGVSAAVVFLPAMILYLAAGAFGPTAEHATLIALGWMVLAAMLIVPQRIIHEEKNPLSRLLQRIYEPAFHAVMRRPVLTLVIVLLLLLSALYPALRLGTEFMPPFDEGDLLYMPTTDPSISVTKSKELLQQTNKLIKRFPEVQVVHGKVGRAETATDPAPLSMIETTIQLEPDREKWRRRNVERFYHALPELLHAPFRRLWPDQRPITTDELKYGWVEPDGTAHPGLNQIVRFPGLANAWPFPIENRLNMLSTGIKTPVGIKIMGPDLEVLHELAATTAAVVQSVPGTVSAYPERSYGGYYLDLDVDRKAAARYGLSVAAVQDVIRTAVGGMNVTTTVEGIERYPLNVRYHRELRDDIPSLLRVLVTSPSGVRVPLGQLLVEKGGERIRVTQGPPMIRTENAQRTAWVFVDVAGRDVGGYVEETRRAVFDEVELPPGYTIVFAGQFEHWEETLPRLIWASVGALAVIVLLLYLSARSWLRVAIILLAVPFSLIGVFWFLWLLGYNVSLAVIIGIIALAGLDAETGQVMLLYLETSYERFVRMGRMRSKEDLYAAVHDGAVKRIRPKAMTVSTTLIGLLPLLWAEGSGADVMRRLAAPMIGGLVVSFPMELLVYPVIFYLVNSRQFKESPGTSSEQRSLPAERPA